MTLCSCAYSIPFNMVKTQMLMKSSLRFRLNEFDADEDDDDDGESDVDAFESSIIGRRK